LLLSRTICGESFQSQQRSLTLLFDVELLRLHVELLLCTTSGVGLFLSRESQTSGFLTGRFACLLCLHPELLLLLTSRLLGLESRQSRLVLRLTSRLSLLERALSKLLLRSTTFL
jgi:hypothetical protein